MEDLMTTSPANTSSEMARSATSTALRVAFRELELYDTGDVAGADEVFAPDLIDPNASSDGASGIDGMRVADGKITEIYHVEELLKLTQQISTGAQPA
jgi:hypothetical protein